MEVLNGTLGSYYDYLFDEIADPRTNSWPLLKSPISPLIIISGYLYFVLYWGPNYMKNKQPYELKYVLIAYNFIQVLISLFLTFMEMDLWLTKFSWTCRSIDHSSSSEAMWSAKGMYMYHLTKIFELLDTIFFVLRKKKNQVTFLHLYHHAVMIGLSWIMAKYTPGGQIMFIVMINSLVHVVMYFYYLAAAMGPQYLKYLWWKKYITVFQFIQFGFIFINLIEPLFLHCDFPKIVALILLPNDLLVAYLFIDFYQKSYTKKKTVVKKVALPQKRNE